MTSRDHVNRTQHVASSQCDPKVNYFVQRKVAEKNLRIDSLVPIAELAGDVAVGGLPASCRESFTYGLCTDGACTCDVDGSSVANVFT